MTDLNTVSLGGRVTRDTKIEKNNQTSFLRVSIAVNRSVYNKDSGQSSDKVTYVEFCLFGKYAESMEKHLKKGTYVTLEGHLEMDSWTDTEGKNHQRLKIVPEIGKINPWVGGKKENTDNAEIASSEMNFPPDDDIPFDEM